MTLADVFVYVPFYKSADAAREAEIYECLQKNIACAQVKRVYLLLEDPEHTDERMVHDKVEVIRPAAKERQTYARMFALMNEKEQERRMASETTLPRSISIVCNADIYFDASLDVIRRGKPMGNRCYALSRNNILAGGEIRPFHTWDSQDTWVFEGTIKPVPNSTFFFGIPGCDNRIAYELWKSGYEVSNPCKTISTYHLHTSGLHTYKRGQDRIDAPYLLLAPCTIAQSYIGSSIGPHAVRGRRIGNRFISRPKRAPTPRPAVTQQKRAPPRSRSTAAQTRLVRRRPQQ